MAAVSGSGSLIIVAVSRFFIGRSHSPQLIFFDCLTVGVNILPQSHMRSHAGAVAAFFR
jgi:uncharacterized membrane protein